MTSAKDPKNTPAWIKSLGLFSVIVTELVGFTGVGIAIGYWAWSRWGAPWWVLLLTSLSGLVVAFYRMYLFSSRISDDESDEKNLK